MNLNYRDFKHNLQIKLLLDSFNNKRLAHAYLFTGEENIGKIDIANFIVKYINCKNPVGNEICKNCSSCKKFKQNIFVDHKLITLEKDKSKISIAQLNELTEFIKFPPFDNKYKTCIISPAEKMGTEAMNYLLKILEEPPTNFFFFLISHNSNLLLPTILSRCQVVNFNTLPTKDIEENLILKSGVEKTKAKIIATLSRGKLKSAHLLSSEEKIFILRKNIILNLAIALKTNKMTEYQKFSNYIIKITNELKKDFYHLSNDKKYVLILSLEFILIFIKDILILNRTQNINNIINQDYLKQIKELADLYSAKRLMNILFNSLKSLNMIKQNITEILLLSNIFKV